MNVKVIAVIIVSVVILAVVKIPAISEFFGNLFVDYVNQVRY